MGAQAIGVVFTGIGVLILFNQMVLFRKVWMKVQHKDRLVQYMLMVFAVGMILQGIPYYWVLIVGIVIATLAQGTLRAIYNSLIAGSDPVRRGENLGIAASLMSLAAVVGPMIATAVIGTHPGLPFSIAGCIGIGIVVFDYILFKKEHFVAQSGDDTY